MSTENKSSLESLKTSISEMSDDDLHKLIAEVRDSRKRPKKPEKAITTVSRGKKGAGSHTVDLEALMGSMTPEQVQILLAKMEGVEKD